MNFFLASILMALAATSATASSYFGFGNSAVVTSMEPMGVETHKGQEVQVYSVNVSVGGTTRFAGAYAPTVTYYATSLVDNFISGYTFCKTKRWNLASPKTPEAQEALEAVLSEFRFPGNAWLGAVCLNERWSWLSDDSYVNFNNLPTIGGAVNAVPACGTTSDAMMIYSPNFGNFGRWFKWSSEVNFESNHVICQA